MAIFPQSLINIDKCSAKAGDPNDISDFWLSQSVMADALQKAQIPVQVLQGKGTGPDAHDLSKSSRVVAKWCAKDIRTEKMAMQTTKALEG